jgi:hypothetical protein
MGMKQTIEVLNRMAADGIVESYAIGGAIAAFNYIEPAADGAAFCQRFGLSNICASGNAS